MADDQDNLLEGFIDGEIVPTNLWFEAHRGDIEFVKFQYAIEALGRYVEMLDVCHRNFLAEERAAFDPKDFLRSVPDGWTDEAEMGAQEELLNMEEAMPHFAFGSALALCFMLREQLLGDLISLTELRKGSSFTSFPRRRRESGIERSQRFLAESWNVSLDFDEETSQALDRLRVLRNKFLHAASKELVPGTISAPEVSVTREDVEAALTAIGSYAQVLESALEAAYGNGSVSAL